MGLYTIVQLFEVALFGGVIIYGVLNHRPSFAVFGAGLLIGKAVLNILVPEGGSVLRRSIVGYGVGAVYVIVCILFIHQYF